jgi:hypothetical protein
VGVDDSIQYGAQVMSCDDLCPPFSSVSNTNFFQHHFGLEFKCDGDSYVRPISSFEFARCFNLSDDLTYRLSHQSNNYCLDASIPALTSRHLMDQCHERLLQIRDANLQIFEPHHIHAPAALANVFVNGAVGARLPDVAAWKAAYAADPMTSHILRLVSNPGLITNESLQKVHHSLRMPLRQQLIVLENDMLIYREPLGDGSTSFCKLRLVPESLRNIIFVAFHANPI